MISSLFTTLDSLCNLQNISDKKEFLKYQHRIQHMGQLSQADIAVSLTKPPTGYLLFFSGTSDKYQFLIPQEKSPSGIASGQVWKWRLISVAVRPTPYLLCRKPMLDLQGHRHSQLSIFADRFGENSARWKTGHHRWSWEDSPSFVTGPGAQIGAPLHRPVGTSLWCCQGVWSVPPCPRGEAGASRAWGWPCQLVMLSSVTTLWKV